MKTTWAALRSFARGLLRRTSVEDDLDAELRCHVDMRADDLMERRGVTREEARLVWNLRSSLSHEGQLVFDEHTVPAKLQLSELFHEVLNAGATDQPSVALPR